MHQLLVRGCGPLHRFGEFVRNSCEPRRRSRYVQYHINNRLNVCLSLVWKRAVHELATSLRHLPREVVVADLAGRFVLLRENVVERILLLRLSVFNVIFPGPTLFVNAWKSFPKVHKPCYVQHVQRKLEFSHTIPQKLVIVLEYTTATMSFSPVSGTPS